MRSYALAHLSDAVLDHDVPRMASNEQAATATFLAYLAEFDARRRYVPAGYPSLLAYCVECLHLSDDAALKRIQAARVARRFPAIFAAVAEGRLHLSGVILLAPHLTHGNAGDLLRSAFHRTKAQIEELLAEHFPRTELLSLVQAIPGRRYAPGHAGVSAPERNGDGTLEHAPGHVGAERDGAGTPEHAPGHVGADRRLRSGVTPHAPGRFRLELTMGRETYEKLQHARALLSHAIPSGDLSEVLDRVLDEAVRQLEKRKFAATGTPRPRRQRGKTNPRHIPAHVKRAVWRRDGGRCTFASEDGHRCNARKFLEFDHVTPVARGGESTVEGVRLRCRAHNQFEAERSFGADIMAGKREAARREAARREAARRRDRGSRADADQSGDLTACLRNLGFRAAEARRAVEFTGTLPETTLEGRVRAALRFLRPGRAAAVGVGYATADGQGRAATSGPGGVRTHVPASG